MKKFNISIFIFCFLIFFSFISINTPILKKVLAKNLMDAEANLETTASGVGYSTHETTTLEVTIGNIIQTLLSLIGILFLILVIIGGYQWMSAGGNEEIVAKAKKRIINATIGLTIVLMAYAISYFIIYTLSSQTIA